MACIKIRREKKVAAGVSPIMGSTQQAEKGMEVIVSPRKEKIRAKMQKVRAKIQTIFEKKSTATVIPKKRKSVKRMIFESLFPSVASLCRKNMAASSKPLNTQQAVTSL
ncbi:hypothetical protein P3X46_021431 [Hevea brasiliensis]|uniref:Uncharacterized protein n=1 Tax=Hevea brasiliensis TaxID=3981 RepID=A0ABQ9LFJ5_HEVBR|nr:hypothetical protein P3X46_021431 [Hevea brasiliensis]